MWRRLGYRLAYWVLALLGLLARWFPRLRAPSGLPLAGNVDGRTFAPALRIRDKRFGASMAVPAVLRIDIDGIAKRAEPHALSPVAERLFAGYAPFRFNVSFACGAARRFRPGVYGDPRSPWFNVFAGYYEIDVAKSAWDRPFGYRRGDAGAWLVDTDDVARLGSADWNYFSNFMYGVPLDAVERIDQPTAKFGPAESTTLAGRRWDLLRVTDMRAASSYLAHGDAGRLVDTVPVLTGIWRCAFGLPHVGAAGDPTPSFVTTQMSGELLQCFAEDATTYRTYIFGGTVGDRTPPEVAAAFLAVQTAAVRALIEREFSHLGF